MDNSDEIVMTPLHEFLLKTWYEQITKPLVSPEPVKTNDDDNDA